MPDPKVIIKTFKGILNINLGIKRVRIYYKKVLSFCVIQILSDWFFSSKIND